MYYFEYAKAATDYYDKTTAENLVSGGEKNILTNGKDCLIIRTVEGGLVKPGEMVFRIKRHKGITVVTAETTCP